MTKTDNSKADGRTTGGQAGMRGYLVQTLVALLDALAPGHSFKTVTLEPRDEPEKVDIRWEYKDGTKRFVQVRSTENYFTVGTVKRWVKELREADRSRKSNAAVGWVLWLVGNCEKGVFELTEAEQDGVEIRHTDLFLPELRSLACQGLARLFESVRVTPPCTEAQALVVRGMALQFEEDSTRSVTRTRQELADTLLTWAALTRIEPLQLATTRLPKLHGEVFVGRDDELERLDRAWAAVLARNQDRPRIITLVAWGGVGKTALLAHWMARLAKRDLPGAEAVFDWSFYSQGIRREGDATGASHAASADLFLKEALEFFGDPALAASNASAWQKGERLAQLVGNRRCLLILDGLEPLQDARTGELRDDGLRSLLRGLAAHNHGLCLVTTRQHLPELATWHQTTASEWELAHLTGEAGAALLTKLGVNGTEPEERDLSARVKGHALTLTLLGRYLKRAHHGDIRRVDHVDFQKVNEKEQGGHAFRVIAAYERWFEENNCRAELAILRMLGLFDRPATPDCLAALRDLPIPGLTDAIALLDEDGWNEAVAHLVELGLVEEQPWEPRRIVGYDEEEAKVAKIGFPLGEPKPFKARHLTPVVRHSLDSHPLIREFFAKRLQGAARAAWTVAHSRLFEHLCASVPHWPDGLDGLQPLYQSITHGCQSGLYQDTCDTVFCNRILRGTSGPHSFYSNNKLGALGANLASLACFFLPPWTRPAPDLSDPSQAWLVGITAFTLRAAGRLAEAREPMEVSVARQVSLKDWKNAARAASNLSELDITLGDVRSAIREAEKAVDFADQGGDGFQSRARATLADALHQSGRWDDALTRFRQAEDMQAERTPKYPLLFSWAGFWFCDLLLAQSASVAWHDVLKLQYVTPRPNLVKACREVENRATESLKLLERAADLSSIGLDHLTLGRLTLCRAILADRGQLAFAAEHLDNSVRHLRQSGQLQLLPLPLLTRAWLRAAQCQPVLARADLDEAQQIAERGPMRLHIADIHLHRARLFRDKEELKKARAMIEQCGYWRRKEELEDAEQSAKSW